MRNLLLTALLLLGLGGTASLPTATSDQPRPAQQQPAHHARSAPRPFLVAFASTNPPSSPPSAQSRG